MKSKTSGRKIGIASERMEERLHQAEDAFRESEERRRFLFENMLDGYAYCKMLFSHHRPHDFIYIDVNPAFERLTGLKDVVGQKVSQVIPGIQDSNPEVFEIYGRVALTGKPERFETYVPSLGIWFSISVFSPVKEYFVAVFENITERKKTENLVRVRMRLIEFAATHSLDEILQKTLDEICEITASPIGFYHFVEADQQTLSLQAWSTRTLQEFCTAQGKGSHYPITEAGVWADCVHQRQPVIHNDYASLPHRKGMPEGHAWVIRELVVPVLRGDRIVAILGVGNKPSDYTERDVKLVTYLADVAWAIAQRKRAEEALQESEARLNRSEEIAHLGSWELDLAKNRLTWSDEVYRIFGLQPQEFGATYEAFLERIHPDDRAAVDAAYSGSLREGKDAYEIEHRVVRKATGEIRWVHEKCRHLTDATGRATRSCGMVLDITERKRAEEALQQHSFELRQLNETLEQRVQERTGELEKANEALRHLSSKLLSAQEEERKRVAGEIHDTLGACLSAAMFKVQDVLRQTEQSARAAAEPLRTIIPVIQEGIDECRRIQMDLRPSMLDDIGIRATLSWFCRRYQTIYSGIRIEEEIDIQEDEIPNALKIVIYRVAQEGLNNIAKHSRAALVHLSLRRLACETELVLQDDGQGFNLEEVISHERTRRGLGLTSMKERVELSGGSFAIESTEGKGTTIRSSWPVHGDG